ncbi:ABC-F family ATP-binding cassette domain-containing protein [Candidatus Dojkabacteria bacterium]|nr:ABC-F family ATP-binding cassette domain-containing protein [Candidatus Dojkabacteria bacterium]
MELIKLENIQKYYGTTLIFEDVNATVLDRSRIGLLGANGIGKSTFCNIIAGIDTEIAGSVWQKPGCEVAYFRQLYRDYETSELNKTVYDYVVESQKALLDIETKYYEALKTISNDSSPKNMQKLAVAQAEYERREGYSLIDRVESTLEGLGIRQDGSGFRNIRWDSRLMDLSGGERKIVELATILVGKGFDVMILDEPLTHLDMHAREWFIEFIKGFKGAVIIVSHDRYVLDELVDTVWTFEQKKFREMKGNYSKYKAVRGSEIDSIKHNWDLYQRELKDKQKKLIRAAEWMRAAGYEGGAVTLYKKLKREVTELKENPPPDPRDFEKIFELTSGKVERSGQITVRFRDFSFGFKGKPLFENVNIELNNGQKRRLAGNNGSGKTTLLKIILTKYCLDRNSVGMGLKPVPEEFGISKFFAEYSKVIESSDIYIGPSVSIGYYSQSQSNLPEKLKVNQFLHSLGLEKRGQVYSMLRRFSFERDDEHKLIRDLSGGEKSRLQLMKIMIDSPNFLLLDEPVNHLDIESREIVTEFLRRYQGSILIISHDKYLADQVVDKEWMVEKKGVVLSPSP